MKHKLLIIAFSFCSVINTTAQKNLTDQEIIDSWCSSKEKRNEKKDSINISFNQQVNKRVIHFIDSLEQTNVDSILIYSKFSSGAYILNKPCFTTPSSEYIYIIWMTNDKLNFKIIAGNCEKNTSQLNSQRIFSYLEANREDIFNTCVMPVIFGAQRLENKLVRYSMSTTSHEPSYLLGLKTGKIFNQLDFSESFLQDKKSLFHEYNLNLKSIYLWNLIEAEIGKSDKL